jgi:hypothetical protein
VMKQRMSGPTKTGLESTVLPLPHSSAPFLDYFSEAKEMKRKAVSE